MKFIFFIYDSRSGSTFLSDKMTSGFSGSYVTPEINFQYFFEYLQKTEQLSEEEIEKRLIKGRVFSSLNINLDSARGKIANYVGDHRCVSTLFRELFSISVSYNEGAALNAVIIKKGNHYSVKKIIEQHLPEAEYLYLVRDPRAVFESRKRTVRPYWGFETMGWSGPLICSFKWVSIARSIGNTSLPTTLVQFEDLQANLNANLDKIGSRHGLFRVSDDNCFGVYAINEKERAIHARSSQKEVDSSHSNIWKSKLSKLEVAAIEMVCGNYMSQFNYKAHTSILERVMLFVPIVFVNIFDLAKALSVRIINISWFIGR